MTRGSWQRLKLDREAVQIEKERCRNDWSLGAEFETVWKCSLTTLIDDVGMKCADQPDLVEVVSSETGRTAHIA